MSSMPPMMTCVMRVTERSLRWGREADISQLTCGLPWCKAALNDGGHELNLGALAQRRSQHLGDHPLECARSMQHLTHHCKVEEPGPPVDAVLGGVHDVGPIVQRHLRRGEGGRREGAAG